MATSYRSRCAAALASRAACLSARSTPTSCHQREPRLEDLRVTHNLAGLPELHDVDDLLSGTHGHGQSTDELSPADLSEEAEYRDQRSGEDRGDLVEREDVGEELDQNGRVDRGALKRVEVGADKEDFVEEAEEEEDDLGVSGCGGLGGERRTLLL